MKKIALSIAAVSLLLGATACGTETGETTAIDKTSQSADKSAGATATLAYTDAEKKTQDEAGYEFLDYGLSDDAQRVSFEIDQVLAEDEKFNEETGGWGFLFLPSLVGIAAWDLGEDEDWANEDTKILELKDYVDNYEKFGKEYPAVQEILDKRGFDNERLSQETFDIVKLETLIKDLGAEAAACIEGSNTYGAETIDQSACDITITEPDSAECIETADTYGTLATGSAACATDLDSEESETTAKR